MPATKKSKKEKRLTTALHDYWDKLRAGREFPSEREVAIKELSHIWSHCFLIKIEEGRKSTNFQYTYLGDSLIDAYGDDLSKEEVSVLIEPSKQRMIEMVRETVKSKTPIVDESEFVNANSVVIRYRQIFLPLGEHGEVKYVIGGMRWKGY